MHTHFPDAQLLSFRVASSAVSMMVSALCLGVTVLAAETPAKSPARAAHRQAPRAERQAIFEAEDRRAPTAADEAVLVKGTKSTHEAVQRAAVRALGRLERPTLIPDIARLLAAPRPTVRADAANALGQVAQKVEQAQEGRIPALLMARLVVERDVTVRGVICQTLGRLPYSSADGMARAEAALLAALAPTADTSAPVPLPIVHGVAKAFESLLRRTVKLGPPSPLTIRRLRTLVVGQRRAQDPVDVEMAARVRRLALVALTSARQTDQDTILAAIGDPDAQVRRLAVLALATAAPAVIPDDVRARVMRSGLADREHVVRFDALRLHGQSLAAATADWSPVFAALADPSPHVALLAIDLLGSAQPGSIAATDRLRGEAGTLPSPRTAPAGTSANALAASVTEWHRAARALASLARVAPAAAAEMLPAFVASPLWPARMYAARTATLIRDEAVLRQLSEDSHDNVRDAAINGLRSIRGHDADDVYIAALQRQDYQIILTAARALDASPQPARVVPALFAALARVTAERRDTSRDPRLALLTRIGELGRPEDAPALLPYTNDFDSRIAAAAAALIGRWTGRESAISPSPLPLDVPRLADVEGLRSARVIVSIAGRGSFELALLTDDAPATVARFVRLVRAGYYTGLTFHRIVPNFLIQGGSPGANEFMGDGPYLRDEIGLQPNVRGSVGISTRGRDTGDAQIFANLVDNPRLDHDYTVFARVVAGLDVLDRILECDVIERIDVVY